MYISNGMSFNDVEAVPILIGLAVDEVSIIIMNRCNDTDMAIPFCLIALYWKVREMCNAPVSFDTNETCVKSGLYAYVYSLKNGGRATSIMVVSPEVSPSGTYIAKWY
jgi:hypothetical protein